MKTPMLNLAKAGNTSMFSLKPFTPDRAFWRGITRAQFRATFHENPGILLLLRRSLTQES